MRRLPVIVLVVAAGVFVGVLIVAQTAMSNHLSPPAFSVNGHEVTQRDLNADLDSIANSGQIDQTSKRTQGSVTSDFGAAWVTRLIQTRLVLEELGRHDLRVTDADRRRLERQAGSQLKGLSSSVKRTILDYNLGLQKLQQKLGQSAATKAVAQAARGAKVSVDPRYGQWNEHRLLVCAPSGCPSSTQGG
ncbi:MAG TPA: hypothetical protein VEP49_14460 [Acidimicrobiia bacterium]|nr:hypothetical protein [Acidimicrobiia bacterium]